MTAEERAQILRFMANNNIPNAHNFLVVDAGLRPSLSFGFNVLWWQFYKTFIAKPTILIFTDQQVILIRLPFSASFNSIADLALTAPAVQVLKFTEIQSLSVHHLNQDYALDLQTAHSHHYFYFYVNEQRPGTQEYNFWHLADNDFAGW